MPIFKAVYKKLSKKWHPQAITVGKPVEMSELCNQIALISTVSQPDAIAAVEALGMVMGTFMSSGRSVHVTGLGTFYYTCLSNKKGVDTEKEVTAYQITGTRVRFIPECTRQGNVITRNLIGPDLTWTNISSISMLNGTGSSTDKPGSDSGGGGDDGDQGQDPLG